MLPNILEADTLSPVSAINAPQEGLSSQSTQSTHNPYSLTERFKDIVDTNKNQMRVTVVGTGSIGSNVVTLLARLGIKDITVYDDDKVEGNNLGHQAYGVSDIGDYKTHALAKSVAWATGTIIKPVIQRTDGEGIETDILVLGVDSMRARKEIVEKAKYSFCIDGRMGGETFNIYTFSGLDKERYRNTLYSDEEASPLPCGGKSIGYISYLVSGLMENQLKKILNSEFTPFEINFCSKTLTLEVSND